MCLKRLLHWSILVNLPKSYINLTTPSHQRHAVFHSFLSDDIKQDAATTTSHSKHLSSFIK